MKVVVCDASPLIILAKLDRLGLLRTLLAGEDGAIIVLKCVAEEVLSDQAGNLERQRLDEFFNRDAKIEEFDGSDVESKSLSSSDRAVLTYSIRNTIDWLVVDERLLRRIAKENHLRVVGALGILVESSKRGLISLAEARADVRTAVDKHDLRISTKLYQMVMDTLAN